MSLLVANDPPDTIPLTPQDLKGVLDPLTAILDAEPHVDAPTPCGRGVPIFDGKQRFDIDLKFTREEPVAGTAGRDGDCLPREIHSHRRLEADRGDKGALLPSNEIEIAFHPVSRQAKLMLPQSIVNSDRDWPGGAHP